MQALLGYRHTQHPLGSRTKCLRKASIGYRLPLQPVLSHRPSKYALGKAEHYGPYGPIWLARDVGLTMARAGQGLDPQ
jgi:hypothetical protein